VDTVPGTTGAGALDVRLSSSSGPKADMPGGPLWVQAVWKRFSYPNNCKQPGVMDLDPTV